MGRECIVINLLFHKVLNEWLPYPLQTKISDNGILGNWIRAVSNQNKHDFPDWIQDFELSRILVLCEELHPEYIENHFNSKSKKKKNLQLLVETEPSNTQISKWIQSRKNEIFVLLIKNEIPLIIEAGRNDILEKKRIHFNNIELNTNLKFTKTNGGLEYKLQLLLGEKMINLNSHSIKIINDNPGWICLDKSVFKISHINANKISPFTKKESIFIPDSITKKYFETFIADLLQKSEIDVEGYPFEIINDIKSAQLKMSYDFLFNEWMIEMILDYGLISFNLGDLRNSKNFISADSENEIQVKRIERNSFEEMNLANSLIELGLQMETNKRFYLHLDEFEIFSFVINNYHKLKEHFYISTDFEKNKKLLLETPEISIQSSSYTDWFDVKAIVQFSSFQIPFQKFISHLKSNQRFFELSDGTYFVIPKEWFTKYDTLLKYGEVYDEGVKLPKAHSHRFDSLNPNETFEFSKTLNNSVEISLPDSILTNLRPYQIEGFRWLVGHFHSSLGACLADDMGLGKTLQTICLLVYAKEFKSKKIGNSLKFSGKPRDLFSTYDESIQAYFKAMIIMPTSLIYNWENEIRKFAPSLKVISHIGTNRFQSSMNLENYDIILTSYQTALRDYNILLNTTFDYIILDESQQIKNKDSKTFKLLHQLKSENRISLSGTPIENSLADLWSQMEFINPKILGSFSFFNNHFIKPIRNLNDKSALEELKEIIQPFILRRTKEQVLSDLPPLQEQVFISEMSEFQKQLYETEKSAVRNQILQIHSESESNNIIVLNSLLKLRQIANHPALLNQYSDFGDSGKFNDICEHIVTFHKVGRKVLLFSSFTSLLKIYGEWMTRNEIPHYYLTGSNSVKEREKAIHDFQNDLSSVFFLISLKAGGTGINLTSADTVIILDPWWNPYAENQAISRAHRMGQRKSVQIIRFIAKDSIEEKILKLQETKKKLSTEILDDQFIPQWINEELEYLTS